MFDWDQSTNESRCPSCGALNTTLRVSADDEGTPVCLPCMTRQANRAHGVRLEQRKQRCATAWPSGRVWAVRTSGLLAAAAAFAIAIPVSLFLGTAAALAIFVVLPVAAAIEGHRFRKGIASDLENAPKG